MYKLLSNSFSILKKSAHTFLKQSNINILLNTKNGHLYVTILPLFIVIVLTLLLFFLLFFQNNAFKGIFRYFKIHSGECSIYTYVRFN